MQADSRPIEAFASFEEQSVRCGRGAQDVAIVELQRRVERVLQGEGL